MVIPSSSLAIQEIDAVNLCRLFPEPYVWHDQFSKTSNSNAFFFQCFLLFKRNKHLFNGAVWTVYRIWVVFQ